MKYSFLTQLFFKHCIFLGRAAVPSVYSKFSDFAAEAPAARLNRVFWTKREKAAETIPYMMHSK